ncbi:hypothetical protein BDZ90DRAFT_230877 [Jaminaea rosea]|uniref:Ino eighty subunit 1 n=1 Tax=Jaminaea rosea TaxID=1569628 RepID=A0A316UUA7_9BASI|nr:hypothetical protein BDZ90DRAFT_230877 [Jaminaea rosea]PWN28869.1 hypothetical protein BDZ90DRAFT_230877 [Jaminaea rosea]
MSSPAAAKRRSISYTPDDDDDDGNSVHSGPSTSVRAPANQGGDVPMAQDADEDEDELEDDDDDDDDDDEEGRDDDEDGDELEPGDETGRADDTAMADVTMADAEVDGQDVKPSSAALSAGSAKKLKSYHISRASEPPIPPDVNPGSANLYSSHTGEKLLRNTPIKKIDGTTFHRSDLQHALLMEIFGDTTRCFRNPRPAPDNLLTTAPRPGEAAATGVPEYSPVYPYGQSKGSSRKSHETKEEYEAWEKRWEEYHKNPYPSREQDPNRLVPRPGAKLLTFKELYMEALMNSPRCTKAVRDKVWSDEQFAEDFACVNLLINVGRMNTTLAFYAQMQTVLRSYHPLPALQGNENSRKHMQDAPRMKSLLKSVLLPFEKASTGPGSAPISKAAQAAVAEHAPAPHEMLEIPSTLEEILKRHSEGRVPATSAVNLIFAFASQANDLSAMHFTAPHDVHSIFFPHKDYPIPAKDRARAFLWLVWHYLEGGALLPPGNEATRSNPFADERAQVSSQRAKAKWDSLDDKGRRKATVGGKGVLWLGVRNKKEPRAAAANEAAASTAGPSGSGSAPTTANSEATSAAHSLISNSLVDDADSGGWVVEDNEKYTHRQLAPDWRVISQEAIREENIDLPDELAWGSEQASERRDFMDRMAEEEAAAKAGKGAGMMTGQGAGEGDDAAESGKGKGKGKGKGTATKGKGKKSRGYASLIPGSAAAIAAANASAGEAGKGKKGKKPRASRAKGAIVSQAEENAARASSSKLTGAPVAGGSKIVLGGLKGRRKSGQDEADEMLADLLEGGGSKDSKGDESAADASRRRALSSLPGYDDDSSDEEDSHDGKGATAGATIGAERSHTDAAAAVARAASSIGGAGSAAGGAGAAGLLTLAGSQSLLPPRRPLNGSDLLPGLRRAQSQQANLRPTHDSSDPSTGPISHTLPGLAWNRILQRAVRGQGDACYSSDDEGEAMDEAERCADLFRGELSRVLNCVWGAKGKGAGKRKRVSDDGGVNGLKVE